MRFNNFHVRTMFWSNWVNRTTSWFQSQLIALPASPCQWTATKSCATNLVYQTFKYGKFCLAVKWSLSCITLVLSFVVL